MALVLAFTDDTPSASDATTYTFSSQAIGTAASDRYVLVGITARAAAGRTISSVTIAGESATAVVFDGTGNTLAAYYIALVTTGTTGDVVVTFSGGMVRCAIAVYAMTGVDPTPADTATSTADPATVNLDIPAGGAAFGLAATGTEPASIAWTNLTADAYLFDTAGYENNNAVGFASEEFASAQTALALTGDFASATSVPNAAFCSFGPSSSGTTYTITPSGGLTFGGTSVDVKVKVIIPTGGITFAGTGSLAFATTGTTYTISPSGGIAFAGSATHIQSKTFIPTGGLTFSGTGLDLRTKIIDIGGGVSFGGTGSMSSNTSTGPVQSGERTKVGVGT